MSSEISTDRGAGGSRPGQLFLILSLLAATAAVLLAGNTAPSNLILISLTIGAVGAVGLAVHRTLWPLVDPDTDAGGTVATGWRRTALEREKTLVLRAIKELEFDKAMGKVADADFEEMAGRLRTRALGLMKQLDELASGYGHLIEREVDARLARGEASTGIAPAVEDTPADGELVCRSCGSAQLPDARFCSQCGERLRCLDCGEALAPDARFCTTCGARVNDRVS